MEGISRVCSAPCCGPRAPGEPGKRRKEGKTLSRSVEVCVGPYTPHRLLTLAGAGVSCDSADRSRGRPHRARDRSIRGAAAGAVHRAACDGPGPYPKCPGPASLASGLSDSRQRWCCCCGSRSGHGGRRGACCTPSRSDGDAGDDAAGDPDGRRGDGTSTSRSSGRTPRRFARTPAWSVPTLVNPRGRAHRPLPRPRGPQRRWSSSTCRSPRSCFRTACSPYVQSQAPGGADPSERLTAQ